MDNMSEEFNIRDFLNCKGMSEQEIERCEFWVTVNCKVRQSKKPNFQGEKIPVNFDWNLQQMEEWMEGYHEKEDLIKFLKFGWPLNVEQVALQNNVPNNQKGAIAHKAKITEYF